MTWVRAQRKRSLAKTIVCQRQHAHESGLFHWLDRTTAELRCCGCGATIARYLWTGKEGQRELVLTYYYEEGQKA